MAKMAHFFHLSSLCYDTKICPAPLNLGVTFYPLNIFLKVTKILDVLQSLLPNHSTAMNVFSLHFFYGVSSFQRGEYTLRFGFSH